MPGPSADFVMPTKYAAYQAVPVGVPTLVTAEEVAMLTGPFANDSSSSITLRVTDANDLPIVADEVIGPKGRFSIPSELSRYTGLKWGCSGIGLYGELLGYPTV